MSKDPLIGRVLHDTHKIVRLIGQGGMGSVYEAVHSRLRQKRFAVKVLHAKMASNDVIYARFKREAEIATSLGHPHIIDVLDFYETDGGRPCMVMEYLEGEDLGTILEQSKKLDREVAIKLVKQVGSALQAVHDKGIVHRDLKPANIFLVCSGPDEVAGGKVEVKVLDFGISKMLDPDSVYTNLTADKAVMGTPHYMSPEQGEGLVKEVDQRTDIFALGTICYQLLSGARPFNAPSLPSVIYKICHADPVPITGHDPDLPEDVGRVLLKALAKKREDRYQQVEDFIRELDEALFASPDEAPAVEEVEETVSLDPNITNVMGIDEVLSEASIRKDSEDQVADPDATDLMGLDELMSDSQGEASRPSSTTLSGAASESQVPETPERAYKGRWPMAAGLGGLVVILAGVGLYFASPGAGPDRPAGEKAAVNVRAASVPAAPGKIKAPGSRPAPRTPVAKQEVETSAPTAPSPGAEEKPAPAPAAAAPETNAVSSPTDPAPRKKAKKVRIRFKLTPAHAVATIDGARHGRMPLVLRRSKRSYKVTVSARGYVSRTVNVTARATRTVRVALKKKPVLRPKPRPAGKTKLITDL